MATNPFGPTPFDYGNPKTTGASGSTGHANNDGLVTGSFETSGNESSFTAPGSNGGQSATDSVTVSHTTFSPDQAGYGTTSATGGTSRPGNGFDGYGNPSDNGAGHGTPRHDFYKGGK